MPVLALPLSVCVALWATRWLADHGEVEDVVHKSHAGAVTDCGGPLDETLRDWQTYGETAVFLALPRPGVPAGMPRTDRLSLAEAAEAGQAAYAPTVGGLLVPRLTPFGPDGDPGLLVEWTAYDAEPVPRHVAESTDLRDLSRRLAEAVQEATERLATVGGIPWRGGEANPPPRASLPGLPPGLAPRPVHLLDRAVEVRALALSGLDVEAKGAALDATTSAVRTATLRALLVEAEAAVVGATNVLAMSIAGWRPA